MKGPYVSVIFANRNDGYGGDQALRFDTFIRYCGHFDKAYPGTFEFVICDWNPPPDRPPLREAADWSRLRNTRFITVDPLRHREWAGESGRPIYDYVARNVAIRRASAPWVLVVNQDIYPTPGIFEHIGRRRLDPRFFYRADRIDFDFSGIHQPSPEAFIAAASEKAVKRHRRIEGLYDHNYSTNVGGGGLLTATTRTQPGEQRDGDLILGKRLGRLRLMDSLCRRLRLPLPRDPDPKSGSGDRPEAFYHRYKLHTNASGDFLLAPKKAFFKIRGFPERKDFYMHTDSYGIYNLFLAGWNQALFADGEAAFHFNHPPTDHYASEEWTWARHVELIEEIFRQGHPHDFSGPDWGLARVPVPGKEGTQPS